MLVRIALKKVMVMKLRTYILFALSAAAFDASAFLCSINGGPWVVHNDNSFIDVYVDIKPELMQDRNIIFDTGANILCRNEGAPGYDVAAAWFTNTGLTHSKLTKYRASIYSSVTGGYHNLPISQAQGFVELQKFYAPNNPRPGAPTVLTIKMSLSPIGDTSGEAIRSGEKLATVNVLKVYVPPFGGWQNTKHYLFNIIANNNVVIPVGGCDVNSRSLNLTMGNYPIDVTEKNINLSVKCGRNRSVSFSLSGRTDTPTIFSNVSAVSPASGIGIEIVRNGNPIRVNSNISMGTVGTTFTPLGLSARYALNGKPLKVGNLQSVIGVNFTYN